LLETSPYCKLLIQFNQSSEARIDVADIIHGNHIGQVCIRPVNLARLLELIMDTTVRGRNERRFFASDLAFGEDHATH
jgi:hypothetical protein